MTTIKNIIEYRFGHTVELPSDADDYPELQVQLGHRTHRAYTDQSVSEALINLLLAATFSAPSKSDLQQTSLIRIKDRKKRKVIAALIPTMPWIGTCPVFFVFCSDGRRIQQVCKIRGKEFTNDNLDNFIAAVCDVGIVLQAFIHAAESLGLGCCPISVIRDHIEVVSELLELPKRVIPVAGMCLGYPAREGIISMRLPLTVSCHTDRYDDSALEPLINEYDQARDAKFSWPKDVQKYTTRFGVADFYGWSEDKARQMAVEERREVGDFVRRHGYSLD